MAFVIGFAVWLAIAIVAGLIAWQSFRGAGTTMVMSVDAQPYTPQTHRAMPTVCGSVVATSRLVGTSRS